MSKIKILKTTKTKEYIQNEIESVKIFKNKLLQDSDYTQVFDCNLSTIEILSWRVWRYKIREIKINEDNYEDKLILLNYMKENEPFSSVSKIKKYPLIELNMDSIEKFKCSCVSICEHVGISKNDILLFETAIKKMNSHYDILIKMDEILNGY